MLQAYIDESFDHKTSVFVLGGFVSPESKWQAFITDWDEILPYSPLRDEQGKPYFHMTEVAARADGLERTQAFYRVIEKHCELAMSAKINTRELQSAISRIVIPNTAVDWRWWRNPYNITFRILMDMFHSHWAVGAQQVTLSESGPVSFIFDDRTEKLPILQGWADFMSNRSPDIRELYGDQPQFHSDKKVIPLQAADFWAWWRRRWYEQNQEPLTFGAWEKTRGRIAYVMDIEYSEDQLVSAFVKLIRTEVGPSASIFDSRTGGVL